MLVQLHWQNQDDFNDTIFVAQTEYRDPQRFRIWVRDLMDRRGNECPDKWLPLCCNENAPMFVKAVPQTTGND